MLNGIYNRQTPRNSTIFGVWYCRGPRSLPVLVCKKNTQPIQILSKDDKKRVGHCSAVPYSTDKVKAYSTRVVINNAKGFMSRSTARVILGQVLRIATCGTQTQR